MRERFSRFSLVLVANHACNLRCTYCYTGKKFHRAMPLTIAQRAMERALASVEDGGMLELGFFGGEPLLEAESIFDWMNFSRQQARKANVALNFSLTTNGTIDTAAAWNVMLLPEVELSISCDGLPAIHDGNRCFKDGTGSFAAVKKCIERLLENGKEFRVVMVLRPGNLSALPAGVRSLFELGVRGIDFSLDLWTRWSNRDVAELELAVARCAKVWRSFLPQLSINWFDEKTALLAKAHCLQDTARCGFGVGEIAVAPSGNLYPCERLIGDDAEANPMRLPGHIFEGEDFLNFTSAVQPSTDACLICPLQTICSTSCRCSNYVRTGDPAKPDGLLCRVDQFCVREVTRNLQPMTSYE
jgi:uncharacterized protein